MSPNTSSWGLTEPTNSDFDLESGSYNLCSRSAPPGPTSDLDRARHYLDSIERNRRRELRKLMETVKQLNHQLLFTRLVVVVLCVFVLCLALGLSRKGCTGPFG